MPVSHPSLRPRQRRGELRGFDGKCADLWVCRGGAPVAPVQHHAALPTSSPRTARRSSDNQEVQLADASAFVTLNGGGGSGGKGPSAGAQHTFSGQPANGHARGAQLPNGIGRTAAAAQRAMAAASPKAARRPGAAGGAAPLLRSAAARRLAEPAQFHATTSNLSAGGATPDSPLPVSTDLEFPVAAAAVAAVPWTAETGLQHPVGADGPTNSLLTCGCDAQLGRAAQRALTAAQAACAERLHLHGSWPWDGVVLATAPLVLLMHVTMPAVGRGASSCSLDFYFVLTAFVGAAGRSSNHPAGTPQAAQALLMQSSGRLPPCSRVASFNAGHSSNGYCVTLAVAAPAFSLLIAGGLRLGIAACAAVWGAAAAALYAAMHLAFQRGEAVGRPIPKCVLHCCAAAWTVLSCVPVVPGPAHKRAEPPVPCRANAVFAVLAFVLSAAWLGTIADEVTAIAHSATAVPRLHSNPNQCALQAMHT